MDLRVNLCFHLINYFYTTLFTSTLNLCCVIISTITKCPTSIPAKLVAVTLKISAYI